MPDPLATETSPLRPVAEDRVRIRPTHPEDLDAVIRLERHEENAPFVMQWSADRHAQAIDDAGLAHWTIRDPGSPGIEGYVVLAGLGDRDRSIELRRLVIARKGRGRGRAVVRRVQRFAFEEAGAHRLWLDLFEDNTRAHRLYASEGFTVEGTLRECVRKDGRFQSLVLMSMLETEYRRP